MQLCPPNELKQIINKKNKTLNNELLDFDKQVISNYHITNQWATI